MLFDKTNKIYIPIKYWENSIGRDKHCDIIVNSPMASRNHAVLFRREAGWFISDTNSKGGVFVNNKLIDSQEKLYVGDVITIGEMDFKLCKVKKSSKGKRFGRHLSLAACFPGVLMALITIFNTLATFLLCLSGENFNFAPMTNSLLITGLSWIYYFVARYGLRRTNFELEGLGIFLSGIGITICSSVNLQFAYTQVIAFGLGLLLFNFIVFFIKNPDFAMKCRPYIAYLAVILLLLNLVFGKVKNGSQNWILIGNFSIQPSEIVKVAFVFFGASTLKEIQTTRNLTGFIIFSCVCMGALFLMGDFGTACIFFVAFLVVAFVRSGSIRTLFLTVAAAGAGVGLILKFKPYIMERFAAWRHVWEHSADIGFQQTRVLSYSASGGLFGMGIGKGCLKYIFAAPSDLAFGMLCEEWGLILGYTVIITIALIGLYGGLIGVRSRCAFYSLASCGASGIMVFQMIMNVFGSVDLLPLTGVTLPFVSLGGSSLLGMWGLLAFIKSADERTYGLKK